MRIRSTLIGVAVTLAVTSCSPDDGGRPAPATSLAPLATTTTSSTTSTTTSTTSTTTTSTTLPPTTTTEPLVVEGGIVLVANASNVPGAAQRLTTKLGNVGFVTTSPVNGAGSDERLEVSRIYARDVNDPVARSVARVMGGVEVLRMPTPVPIESGVAGDATVVVMLGRDLADEPLTL